jgi:hypothetical protein
MPRAGGAVFHRGSAFAFWQGTNGRDFAWFDIGEPRHPIGSPVKYRPQLSPRSWGRFVSERWKEAAMTEESEIQWHIEQIAENRAILEQLEDGNTAGSEVFPETQSEIERVKAQIAQSELIVASYQKKH